MGVHVEDELAAAAECLLARRYVAGRWRGEGATSAVLLGAADIPCSWGCASGQLEGGERGGYRPGALQEAAAVHAQHAGRVIDRGSDQVVDRPVVGARGRGDELPIAELGRCLGKPFS